MKLKEFELKIGHTVDIMTYEEMYEFLHMHKDDGINENLSACDAYWLERLYNDNSITSDEYNTGVEVLREAIRTSKSFRRIFIEAEDPSGTTQGHWEFFSTD